MTQSYKGIPKKLREQVKAIFVWNLKARIDLEMIHDRNDVLTELIVAREFLALDFFRFKVCMLIYTK